MADPTRSSETKWRILILNKRVLISLVLLIVVVLLITSNTFWRWMYPIGYQSTIQVAASESNVDPLLVASVVRTESKFKPTDVSHAGAIGLMQLMPQSATWIAQQMAATGISIPYGADSSTAKLAEPTLNIRLGSWYIHYLTKQFDGNQIAAVAAYNAGPKRVSEWLSEGVWNGRLEDIERIPVGETRHFVDRVFYNYDLYKRIYGSDPKWHQRP